MRPLGERHWLFARLPLHRKRIDFTGICGFVWSQAAKAGNLSHCAGSSRIGSPNRPASGAIAHPRASASTARNFRFPAGLQPRVGWIESVHEVTGEIPIVLAINQQERSAREQVTDSDAKEFSMRYGAPCFCASSETGENVDAIFNPLGTRVLENRFGHMRGSTD